MTRTKQLPEVTAFLGERPIRMFIGGQWVAAADNSTFQTRDPGSGEVMGTVAEGKAMDIDRAVRAARHAFQNADWAYLPVKERSALLHRLADLVEEHREILVQLEALDVGKPLAQADGFDIPNVAETLRYYADLAVKTSLQKKFDVPGYEARQAWFPHGVTAFVLPWNFPLLLVGWNLAPSLAAGNTAVIKPAEDTPLTTLYFGRLVEKAGIPAGVVNVVPGYGEIAGAALASHPGINRMGFTGSPEVGRLIASACGSNLVPVKLELGGKGAALVFDDADPEVVADQLVAAVTLNTGQVCCTATRWMLHKKIWNAFVPAARKKLEALKIGHGLDEGTDMGPAVSEKQRQRILDYVERGLTEGAEPVLPGGKAKVAAYPGGYYVKPCLLTGGPENVCAREEIFGPVAYLMRFEDEDEAIDMVHHTPYGLANSVWTNDSTRANRVAERMVAGSSWINGHNLFPHGVPYGGCNLSGLGGGVLGPDTLFDYLRPQSIVQQVS
jgi:aldehyde dehydrogenase (NAD+)